MISYIVNIDNKKKYIHQRPKTFKNAKNRQMNKSLRTSEWPIFTDQINKIKKCNV